MSTRAFKILLEPAEKQGIRGHIHTAQHHPVRDFHLGIRITAFLWAQL